MRVVRRLPTDCDPLAAAAAALAHAHEAYVRIGDVSGAVVVSLEPKVRATPSALKALARSFDEELAAQSVRWALARHNRGLSAEMAANAADAARAGAAAPPPPARLSPEEAARIAALAAEPVSDPLGIRASWSDSRGGNTG